MGNKQILKLVHIPSSLILPASPNVQEPAQRAHLSKTAHAKLDHKDSGPTQATSKIWFPMPTPYPLSIGVSSNFFLHKKSSFSLDRALFLLS